MDVTFQVRLIILKRSCLVGDFSTVINPRISGYIQQTSQTRAWRDATLDLGDQPSPWLQILGQTRLLEGIARRRGGDDVFSGCLIEVAGRQRVATRHAASTRGGQAPQPASTFFLIMVICINLYKTTTPAFDDLNTRS